MKSKIKGSTNSIVGIIKITHLNIVKLRSVLPPISTPPFPNAKRAFLLSCSPSWQLGYVYLSSGANFPVIIIFLYSPLYSPRFTAPSLSTHRRLRHGGNSMGRHTFPEYCRGKPHRAVEQVHAMLPEITPNYEAEFAALSNETFVQLQERSELSKHSGLFCSNIDQCSGCHYRAI
jgi:hypothetical protein